MPTARSPISARRPRASRCAIPDRPDRLKRRDSMLKLTRRGALGLAAGTAGSLILPRFAIGQSDDRPSINIAVQKISNSNTLDVLREQSNVGTRIFSSSLWEGLIGLDW